MNAGMVLLLIFAIAVLNLIFGGVVLFRRGMSRRVTQRLENTVPSADRQEVGESLRRKGGFGRGSGGLVGGFRFAPFERINHLLETSGTGMASRQLYMIMTGLAAAVFLAVLLLARLGVAVSAAAGIAAGIAVPLFVVQRIRNARYAMIAAQLPDAVDSLARSLRAGHPVPTGISMIAHEMPDPIGAEFRIVHEEMTYGLDLKDALAKMGERVDVPDIHYMIVAMRIQAGTGGSLAEILNSLGSVIRARQNLFAKVRALSAESRFAGKILGSMPFAVVGVLLLMNPHYYDAVKTSTGLAITLGVAAFLAVVGVLLMRKVVNIRV